MYVGAAGIIFLALDFSGGSTADWFWALFLPGLWLWHHFGGYISDRFSLHRIWHGLVQAGPGF